MIKTITGCLIKYNRSFPNGVIIDPGAFDECQKRTVPVTTGFGDYTNIIGYCDLEYKEDGVYYTFRPETTEKAIEFLKAWDTASYIGASLRKCEFIHADPEGTTTVTNGEIVSGHVDKGHYESAYVDKITFELEDESNDN